MLRVSVQFGRQIKDLMILKLWHAEVFSEESFDADHHV